jgi:hypothetical protein
MYARESNGRIVEVAKVVSVHDDRAGIPHVRFELSYQRPTRIDFEGLRMLALDVFAERYRLLPED